MIEINISKRIKAYNAVELKVNTSFESERITRISGPSGVGKTTLLKILAGLILPEEGLIKVDDELWFDARSGYAKKTQERNVGFVFQDYALFPNMTVEQQLQFGTKDERYINRLLTIGQMETFRKSLPKYLSGGQQQRLAILRALTTKPKLLLMDEPFSALDQVLKTELMMNLQELFAEQGSTVLLVTHGQEEIADSKLFEI